MIEFSSEAVRTEFHLLPVETQIEYNDLAVSLLTQGKIITILAVYIWGNGPDNLELAVRIDSKFDPVSL